MRLDIECGLDFIDEVLKEAELFHQHVKTIFLNQEELVLLHKHLYPDRDYTLARYGEKEFRNELSELHIDVYYRRVVLSYKGIPVDAE
jgi:hypothetical protein